MFYRARGAYRANNYGESAVVARDEILHESDPRLTAWEPKARAERFERLDDDHPDVVAHRAANRSRIAEIAERTGGEQSDSRRPAPSMAAGRGRERHGFGARTSDLARSTIDENHRHGLPDRAAEKAARLVSDGPDFGQYVAARWVNAVGDPDYARAFSLKLLHGDDARDYWTDAERAAWGRAGALHAEFRALGLADLGTAMLPLTMDPSILLTSDGSANPIRRLARVEQISTTEWQGVTSQGVVATWTPEAQEQTDDSPTVGDVTIKAEKESAFVPYSVEAGQDASTLAAQLTRLLTEAADTLALEAFTNGDGTNKPFGFVTGATAVATASVGALAADDIYALQESLGPRWQANAAWAGALATLNSIDAFETGNGSKMFPQVGEGRLLRKPVEEIANLAATVATGNAILAYGSWRDAYTVVDRIGTSVELIPHLFGAARRPTGQRGLWMHARVGGKVVVPQALRVLTVA